MGNLRVLHIGNFSAGPCGIRNFAEQASTALRNADVDVTDWDGTYGAIYARLQTGEPAYLPADADTYDVVHLTWNSLAINHYHVAHFAGLKNALTSIYLTDVAPYCTCPCLDAFKVRVIAEPHEWLQTPCSPGCVLPYPVPDWIDNLPLASVDFTIGWTGLRGDGLHEMQAICEKEGYTLNLPPPGWRSLEDEVRRLARSSVNVCWYAETRNLASAPSMCLASGRPLLLNHSPMFTHLRAFPNILWAEDLAGALRRCLVAWASHTLPFPTAARQSLAWSAQIPSLLSTWQEALR